jgi:hypothetical protein
MATTTDTTDLTKVFLFDLDGSLADYDGTLLADLERMRSPAEPTAPDVREAFQQPHLRVLRVLAGLPEIKRLQTLEFTGYGPDDAAAHILLGSPHIGPQTKLSFDSGFRLTPEQAREGEAAGASGTFTIIPVRPQRELDMGLIGALKAVGYWRPSEDMLQRELECGYGGKARKIVSQMAARRKWRRHPLPNPACLVWAGWGPAELPGVLAYLRAGQEWIRFNGWSYCRFGCGIDPIALGDRDLTDGVWVWPEGLAHYVETHSVRLPDEFIDHMRSQGWRVPTESIIRWVELAAADRPEVDFTFWIAWSRRMAVSVPPSGRKRGHIEL